MIYNYRLDKGIYRSAAATLAIPSRTFTDLRSSIDLQITLRLAILGFFLNYIFKSVKSVKKWNVLPKSNLQLLALKLMICKIVLLLLFLFFILFYFLVARTTP